MLRCTRMFNDEVNTLLVPFELNYSLWQVMFVLNLKQHCTSIDLAEYLNISKPSIAKRVKILTQMQIFEHIKTEDKRMKMLKLSSHGQDIYQQCYVQIQQFEQLILKPFHKEEVEQAQHLLEQIMQQLQSHQSGQ
ncbi:MarR family transcriptional regulator [Acinetobacter wuhouensis]|nr:MarR family transcriptional regulator [Acinetobacter wuhouensis]